MTSQGKNCYKLNEVNFSAGVPGYVARANKLGYRTVAGASGTTANILQYALVRVQLVVIELPSGAGGSRWQNFMYSACTDIAYA